MDAIGSTQLRKIINRHFFCNGLGAAHCSQQGKKPQALNATRQFDESVIQLKVVP